MKFKSTWLRKTRLWSSALTKNNVVFWESVESVDTVTLRKIFKEFYSSKRVYSNNIRQVLMIKMAPDSWSKLR